MQNLRCVLVATVRGARGSCVLLLIGLTTPSCADVTGRQHHFHPPGWASAPMKTLDDSSSAVAGVRSAGACGLPVSGGPRPVSARPDSRYPAGRVDLAHLTGADEQAQRVRRCPRVEWRLRVRRRSAARGRTPWRCLGGCGTGHRGRCRCCIWNHGRGVRTVGVRTLDVRRGHCHRSAVSALQEPVARSAAAGRVPPPPVRPGELVAEPVAELGAQVGHGWPLQGQGFLGGQPAQPQP
jgi:hypothetical protein